MWYYILAVLLLIISYSNVACMETYSWQWVAGSNMVDMKGVSPFKAGFQKDDVTYWPSSRGLGSAVVDENTWMAYQFGGYGVGNRYPFDKEPLSSMWALNTTDMQWWMVSEDVKCGIAPSSDAKCMSTSAKPAGRFGNSMIMHKGWIIVYGGRGYTNKCAGGIGLLDDVWMWSAETWEWEYAGGSWSLDHYGMMPAQAGAEGSVNFHPGARMGHAAGWFDGSMFIFGGMGVNSTGGVGTKNDLWSYNIGNGKWKMIGGSMETGHCGNYNANAGALWPSARSGHTAVVSHGTLYMFGGNGISENSCGSDCGRLNDLWSMDFRTMKWSFWGGDGDINGAGSSTWPSARLWHAMAMDGPNLVVYGGSDTDLSNQVWTINTMDVATSTDWTMISGTANYMPVPVYPDTVGDAPSTDVWPGGRSGATAVLVGHQMLLFGGVGLNDTTLDDAEQLFSDVWLLSSADSCTGSSNCHANAHCADAVTGYNCVCNVGYVGDGWTCELEGSHPFVDCPDCDCQTLKLKNGWVEYSGTGFGNIGDWASFNCDDGYYLELMGMLETTTECITDSSGTSEYPGMWNNNMPACWPVACPNPTIDNGFFSVGGTGKMLTGDVVNYQCEAGYTLSGSESRTCQGVTDSTSSVAKSQLSGTQPTCTAMSCGSSETISNGKVAISGTGSGMTGESLTYSCNSMYKLVVESGWQTRWCVATADGTAVEWNGAKPECVCSPMSCPFEEQNPANGFATFPSKSSVKYDCKTGYKMSGSPSASCDESESPWKWSKAAPTCEISKCKDPNDISKDNNLQWTISGTGQRLPGEYVTYSCKNNFNLFIGDNAYKTVYCKGVPNGVSDWDGNQPYCVNLTVISNFNNLGAPEQAQITNIIAKATTNLYTLSTAGIDTTGVSLFKVQDGKIIVKMMILLVVVFGLCCLCTCRSCLISYRKRKAMKRALSTSKQFSQMKNMQSNTHIELN